MEDNPGGQPASGEAEQPVLVFHLGERAFALQIESVVQVIPMLKLTPVPQVKQTIAGVANIHGQTAPVLNARQCLGLPQVTPQLNTPIILTRTGERMLGLIVDEVNDVIPLSAGQLIQPDALLPDGIERPAILKGAAYLGEKAIIIIDPGHLLNPAQLAALDRAIKALVAKDPPSENGGGASPSPKRDKPRGRRKNLDHNLSDQIAGLASDLPPMEGQQPFPPVDPFDPNPV